MNWLELLGFGSIIDFEKEDEGMEKEEMIERLVAFRNGWENPKSATPDFWEGVIEAVKVGDDAISRQAALDACNQSINLFEAADRIRELPPVKQEPCDDTISRQAVIEVLNKMDRYVADELTLCDTERKFPQNEVFIVDDVYEEIVEQLPPVTLQSKIGKWRTVKHYGRDYYQCTYCSMERIDDHSRGWNYCPFCGAKMSDVDA